MRKIKKGDNVVVIAGRDKGKRGDVAQIVDDEHVVVDGINQVKKHTRPNPMKNQPGGIVNKEMPIHVSNVAICNPVTQKADRIGIPHARGRPQGPLLQVQRRADRRVTETRHGAPEGNLQEGNRARADRSSSATSRRCKCRASPRSS